MLTHEAIWRGIDRLAMSAGYSASALAKKAGLDATSFNRSKRTGPDGKPRWPSTESLAKVLAVTNTTMSDFISLIDPDADPLAGAGVQKPAAIPVIGFAQAGKEGYFDADGYPAGDAWDELPFPAPCGRTGEKLYALEVSGESMLPVYRPGDRLVLSPAEKIRRGDRVVVKTLDGEVMAKELTRRNAGLVDLRSLNPACDDFTLPENRIGWMARVMWVSQ